MANKEKQAVWLYPEVKELLTTHMAAANAKSQSDFIEKAIRFYAGYLDCNSENMTEYLGETVSAVIDGIVKAVSSVSAEHCSSWRCSLQYSRTYLRR